MNPLDYVLISIVGYFLVRGAFRGLIKELSSIIGVFGGFYFAYSYYSRLSEPLKRWITDSAYVHILSFLILFVGVYLVISIAGGIIKYLMNIVFMGWTDRLLGAMFGALKGVLIVAVVAAMLTTFLPGEPAILTESYVVRRVNGLSALMVRAASADVQHVFDDRLKALKRSWQTR